MFASLDLYDLSLSRDVLESFREMICQIKAPRAIAKLSLSRAVGRDLVAHNSRYPVWRV